MDENSKTTPLTDTLTDIEKERRAINALLDKGTIFQIPRKKLLGLIKLPPHQYRIRQPYLGTLDHLADEFLSMNFDEEKLKADPFNEGRRLEYKNSRAMARVVAIAVLNGKWKIRLFTKILASYFRWKITPSRLWQLTMVINTISNIGDFTNSIRSLSLARTTAPKADPIEKKSE